MKKIAIILCLVCLLTVLFSACDFKNNTVQKISASTAVKKRFVGKSVDQIENIPYDLESCYKFGDNQYMFLFYLGRITDVPIQGANNVETIKYQGGTYTYSIKQSATTTEEIVKASETVKSHCVTNIKEVHVDSGIEIGFEEEGNIEGGNFIFSGEGSFKMSQKVTTTSGRSDSSSTSNTETVGESYEQGVSNSSNKEVGVEIEFDSNSELGMYRWVFMGTFDCFAYVYADFDTKKFYLDSAAFLKQSYYTLDFTDSDVFDDNSTDQLKFDSNYLDKLVVPENVFDLTQKDDSQNNSNVIVNNTQILSNSDAYTISDGGNFGLKKRTSGNQLVMETLDLSEYDQYFIDDYMFCFELDIVLTEKDQGYQEVFLYDNNTKFDSSDDELAHAISYGMICGSRFTHNDDSESDYVYWYVRGDKIKETMYIRYDAMGNQNDTWYKSKITVNLTVVEKSATYTDTQLRKEISVDDTGVYGLAQRSSDSIDISKLYNLYLSDENSTNSLYCIVFDFAVNMHEVYNGIQEFHLYNKVEVTNADISFSQAREKGLVDSFMYSCGGTDKITSSCLVEFSLQAMSNQLAESMNLRYDTHGDLEDDWVREDIKISYTLFNIPKQNHTSTAIKVLSATN